MHCVARLLWLMLLAARDRPRPVAGCWEWCCCHSTFDFDCQCAGQQQRHQQQGHLWQHMSVPGSSVWRWQQGVRQQDASCCMECWHCNNCCDLSCRQLGTGSALWRCAGSGGAVTSMYLWLHMSVSGISVWWQQAVRQQDASCGCVGAAAAVVDAAGSSGQALPCGRVLRVGVL